jgi:hypothetical protein
MKKLLFLAVIPCLLFSTAMAQPGIHLGVKGGANMTKIKGEQFKDAFNFNYHLGAFLELGLTQKFGIQPELIFSQSTSQTGTRFSDIYNDFPGGDDQKVKLNYLNIPVLANIKFSNALWLQLGPQFSILMDDHKSLGENTKSAFKDGDFSAVAGLWLQLPVGLSLSARYIIGLSNINDISNENEWRSQAIQLGIGFTIF